MAQNGEYIELMLREIRSEMRTRFDALEVKLSDAEKTQAEQGHKIDMLTVEMLDVRGGLRRTIEHLESVAGILLEVSKRTRV